MKTDQKTDLRLHIKSLFDTYSSDELNTFSSKINIKLLELVEVKKIRTIGFFAPLKDEPNIWPVFETLKESISFFFPRVTADQLEFLQIASKDKLNKGEFGILEPQKDLWSIDPSVLDCVLVPGVAFDEKGNRLGRGGGYYDRFLEKSPRTVLKVGICFPFQVLSEVPVNEDDQKVDVVIS